MVSIQIILCIFHDSSQFWWTKGSFKNETIEKAYKQIVTLNAQCSYILFWIEKDFRKFDISMVDSLSAVENDNNNDTNNNSSNHNNNVSGSNNSHNTSEVIKTEGELELSNVFLFAAVRLMFVQFVYIHPKRLYYDSRFNIGFGE